jgi:hypothetical protein
MVQNDSVELLFEHRTSKMFVVNSEQVGSQLHAARERKVVGNGDKGIIHHEQATDATAVQTAWSRARPADVERKI